MKKIILMILFFTVSSSAWPQEPLRQSAQMVQEGTVALRNGEIERGITLLEQAIKLNPNDYIAISALAGVYSKFKKDYQKSVQLFEQAIQLRDDYDMAHFGLGLTYAELGFIEKAREQFQKTMVLTDKDFIRDAAQRAIEQLSS